MAEVVYNSLQYLNDDDTQAMAVYLKSIAEATSPPPASSALPTTESSLLISLGKTVYDKQCASCHGAQGEGKPPHYPPLAGNQSIEMESAVNPIRMVLNGGYPPGTEGNPMPYGMPPFARPLSDNEVAAVVTYIRTAWGNRGTPVSGARGQRAALRTAELRARHDQLRSADQPEPTADAGASSDIVAAGPRGAIALAGIATAIVVAIWFAFYLFVFLPRGAAAMTRRATTHHAAPRSPARVERRWATICRRSSSWCWRCWRPSPASTRRRCRRRASRPSIRRGCTLRRVRREQSRQRCWSRTAR